MSFISRLLGKPQASSGPASILHPEHSRVPNSPNATRRELVRVVLRDTLLKHGIPGGWIGVEMLSLNSGGAPSLHVRLLIKHWDRRLLECGVAFQNSLSKRVCTFDPTAEQWLNGISWQFSLADESPCPPMPSPAIWSEPDEPRTSPAASTPSPSKPEADQLEQLRQMLAVGDAKRASMLDGNGDGDGGGNYEKTQPFRAPMPFSPTEPSKL